MPFRAECFDPDEIKALEKCLDIACADAVKIGGMQPIGGELRLRLATALMEGAIAGITDQQELVDFALNTLPLFRAPGSSTSQ